MSEHKVREANEAKAREERKAVLLEAFEKDAESVLLRSEIIFGGVSLGDGRYGIQSGEYPGGLVKQVAYDLLFRSMMLFQHMEFQKAMEAKNDKRILTGGV